MPKNIESLENASWAIKALWNVLIIGVIFWMFCSWRDIPAVYQTKAEAKEQAAIVQQLNKEQYDGMLLMMNRQFDRVFLRLDKLNDSLRKEQ